MPSLLNLSSRLLSLTKHGWFYIFSHGFLFASDGLDSESVRLTASVLLSLTRQPFDVEVASGRQRGNAFLVRPGMWRCVTATHTPIVSIGLSPTHPSFRHLSTTSVDLLPVPRENFAACDEQLHAARAGLLSPRDAHAVGGRVVQAAEKLVPEPAPLDARIERVLSLINEKPTLSLTQLAAAVDLSYYRLSHLFSQEMGITLRMYVISRKLDLAAMMAGQGLSLTQIAIGSGFADSAHFCRTWMRTVGSPPSQLLNSQRVGIRSAYGPD